MCMHSTPKQASNMSNFKVYYIDGFFFPFLENVEIAFIIQKLSLHEDLEWLYWCVDRAEFKTGRCG